ncbi:myc-family transcription factor [Scheffersomyces xylosifermentans]|uniref:myc-family transcription factor n=1 Tax=Scheffersomyces xylosifermentans TaxID=1304137 RepID=UPI00315DEE78
MESSVWNSTFSPNNPGTTPGKSPYYHDLSESANHQQQQPQQNIHQHHDNSNTGTNSHNTPSSHAYATIGQSGLAQAGTPSNFTDTEQLFLHQLEQNLYEAAAVANQTHHHHHHHHHHHPSANQSTGNTPNSNLDPTAHTPSTSSTSGGLTSYPHDIPPPPQSYEFGIENINFIIPEDLNFDTDPNHESSAFPPSHMPPTQTPNLLAANKNLAAIPKKNGGSSGGSGSENDPKVFASPILPGQNEKSYNNQHFYHKHNSKLNDTYVVAQQQGQQAPQQHVRPDAVFTPLVSPAVTPLDTQVNLNKGPGGSSNSSTAVGSSSSAYSQQPPVQVSFEPLTSPALNAQPSLGDRRRSSSSMYGPGPVEEHSHAHTIYNGTKRRTPHGTPIMSANKSSPQIKGRNAVVNGGGTFRTSPVATNVVPFEKLPESSMETSTNDNSNSTTPMLPPQGKKVDISNSNSNNNGNAPLMGGNAGGSTGGLSRKSSSRSSRKSSFNNSGKLLPKSSSSSTETSPRLLNQKSNGSLAKKGEKPATKKASHKLAEQGRRNRMNMAVHELGSLIPQTYHDEVTIPSKATTVELASKYIRTLLKELDELKKSSR